MCEDFILPIYQNIRCCIFFKFGEESSREHIGLSFDHISTLFLKYNYIKSCDPYKNFDLCKTSMLYKLTLIILERLSVLKYS
jgi:hypothetical protein